MDPLSQALDVINVGSAAAANGASAAVSVFYLIVGALSLL
jgi:hypothetical protein